MASKINVQNIEKVLKGMGFYRAPISRSKFIHHELRLAIQRYQESRGLPANGRYDRKTANWLAIEVSRLANKGVIYGQDRDVHKQIEERYGPGMAMYVNHPELGPLLAKAAKAGWDALQLQGHIQRTTWWRNTSDAARRWDQLRAEDPATAQQQLAEKLRTIHDKAIVLDVKFGSLQEGTDFALRALRFAWTDEEIDEALAARYNPKLRAPRGAIGNIEDQLKKIQKAYFIPWNEQKMREKARRIAMGEGRVEDTEAALKLQAKARFPHLAKIIDSGVTPEDYFAGHREAIARELERSPDSIDFINDKFMQKVLDIYDPRTKTRRPMTISEAAEHARRTQSYKSTRAANEQGANMAMLLAQTFGEIK